MQCGVDRVVCLCCVFNDQCEKCNITRVCEFTTNGGAWCGNLDKKASFSARLLAIDVGGTKPRYHVRQQRRAAMSTKIVVRLLSEAPWMSKEGESEAATDKSAPAPYCLFAARFSACAQTSTNHRRISNTQTHRQLLPSPTTGKRTGKQVKQARWSY